MNPSGYNQFFIKPVFVVRRIKYGPELCGAQFAVLKATLVIIIIQLFKNIEFPLHVSRKRVWLASVLLLSMCSGPHTALTAMEIQGRSSSSALEQVLASSPHTKGTEAGQLEIGKIPHIAGKLRQAVSLPS